MLPEGLLPSLQAVSLSHVALRHRLFSRAHYQMCNQVASLVLNRITLGAAQT